MTTSGEQAPVDAWAIRHRTTGLYLSEDDAGEMMFRPLGPETFFFDYEDDERLYAYMSAAPGGHEAVEQVRVQLTIMVLDD